MKRWAGARQWGPRRGEEGQATFTLVIVLVAFAVTIFLLYRAESNASDINHEAATIAKTGQGVNSDADSIIQLNQTNKLASSILASAQPLQGQLAQVVNLAEAVNGTAVGINNNATAILSSARSINSDANSVGSSAATINTTAKGINTTAATILTTANSVLHAVNLINDNLVVTIGLAQQILGSAGNILTLANSANHTAACIQVETNLAAVSGC